MKHFQNSRILRIDTRVYVIYFRKVTYKYINNKGVNQFDSSCTKQLLLCQFIYTFVRYLISALSAVIKYFLTRIIHPFFLILNVTVKL